MHRRLLDNLAMIHKYIDTILVSAVGYIAGNCYDIHVDMYNSVNTAGKDK